MEVAFGMLISMLIGTMIASLIGAILLRADAKWVQKIDVPFSNAYVTSPLAGIVNVIIGFLVGFVARAGTWSQEAVIVASLLMWPVGFLIQSVFVSSRIRIPFGRACLVSLAMIGIALEIGVPAAGPPA